jgi:hypothetical protein
MKDLAQPTMSFPLTKSHFLAGLQCSKRLWLSICKPEYGSPPSLAQQQRGQQGLAIGMVARQSFPDGALVTGNLHDALERTQNLLAAEANCILGGAFIYDDILVRPDAIQRLPNGNWEIIEVKSALGLQEEHIPDLTLQWYVLEGAGLEISKASVMSVNPQIEDWADVASRFNTTDVTIAVQQWREQLQYFLTEFRGLLTQSDPPSVQVGHHCHQPYPCQFKDHCWQGIGPLSVFTIPHLNTDQLHTLLEGNMLRLRDIPPHFPLSLAQQQFVEQMLKGEPWIDRQKIRQALNRLVGPLHFLSLEVLQCAVPPFKGLHPYELCPFQYNLCTLDGAGNLSQQSYVHLSATDPRQCWLDSLIEKIGYQGSVVVYNRFLELSVLENLVQYFPHRAASLVSIVGRCWGLQWIFEEAYQDPHCPGSVALQDILPVLLPHWCDRIGAIDDHGEASVFWQAMIDSDDAQEKDHLQNRLEHSCSLKTLAMVEIYHFLCNVL